MRPISSIMGEVKKNTSPAKRNPRGWSGLPTGIPLKAIANVERHLVIHDVFVRTYTP